jgi:hypothetical protein
LELLAISGFQDLSSVILKKHISGVVITKASIDKLNLIPAALDRLEKRLQQK